MELDDLSKKIAAMATSHKDIKCGSVVAPFDNQISKNTDLYKLYNTNLHKKFAEMKKKQQIEELVLIQPLLLKDSGWKDAKYSQKQ